MTVTASPNVMPLGLLTKFRDATAAAYEAQGDVTILWRLAEMDRALGNLEAAAAEFGKYAELHPEEPKAGMLRGLMDGTGGRPVTGLDGVIPFVLVEGLAPEAELLKIKKAIEERRERFQTAMVGQKEEQRVDVNYRAAVYVRADAEFRAMTRGFFRTAMAERRVLERLGLGPVSETKEEVEAIAYASKGKYATHRDNAPSVDNGRVLTVVWFIHDEPKGFSGGDLLLHDEPPAGQGFTRIVPKRNMAIFFPSGCLHEVTPVESTVEDVLQSRMVLNGWFHEERE